MPGTENQERNEQEEVARIIETGRCDQIHLIINKRFEISIVRYTLKLIDDMITLEGVITLY